MNEWIEKKSSLPHLKTFGCDIYVHIPKEKRHKLDVKSQKFILVGYSDNAKFIDYTTPLPTSIISKDVIFAEEFNYKT
jgi:hypothetical protein